MTPRQSTFYNRGERDSLKLMISGGEKTVFHEYPDELTKLQEENCCRNKANSLYIKTKKQSYVELDLVGIGGEGNNITSIYCMKSSIDNTKTWLEKSYFEGLRE